jgi:hypothetical protein
VIYDRPWGVINPVACPINSRINISTDRLMRQVSDFSILSDLSPFAIAESAVPRLTRTTASRHRMKILNIMVYLNKSCKLDDADPRRYVENRQSGKIAK